jgi:hypothetical protein
VWRISRYAFLIPETESWHYSHYLSRKKIIIIKIYAFILSLFMQVHKLLLKHVIKGKLEGRIEMTGRRGRRRKQLLDDFEEKRRYWKLKEVALDRTLWRTCFGRGYRPVVRQTTE